MRSFFVFLSIGLVGLNGVAAAEDRTAEGQQLFERNCAFCHGIDAKGDGPKASSLRTAPDDLTKIADRRNGVWPVLEVTSIIDGYARRSNPRPDMPIMSEIVEGPVIEFDTGNGLVTNIPLRLLALAEYLESIQSPPPDRYVP